MESDFVKKCLEISTAHITQVDAALLGNEEIYWSNDEFDVSFTGICYTYCWVIGVPTWPIADDLAKAVQAIGFSKSFTEVMLKARELNCDYVKLDRDSSIMDSLTTHDW